MVKIRKLSSVAIEPMLSGRPLVPHFVVWMAATFGERLDREFGNSCRNTI